MPDRMKVDRDDKGQIYYEYFVSDSDEGTEKQGRVKLNELDVLHIPGLGFDGLVGYSPQVAARHWFVIYGLNNLTITSTYR